MQLHLDPHDGVPLYQQIVSQIKLLLATGRLRTGEDIPPIRTLAQQLRINPNTVARAYLELEHAGIVGKRPGWGTYVADTGSPLDRRQRLKILSQRADGLLAEARHLGFDLDAVVDLLRDRDRTMKPLETR